MPANPFRTVTRRGRTPPEAPEGALARRRRTDLEPNHGALPVTLIALVVAAIDWSTKAAIVATVPLGELRVVWEGRVAFWHVRNPAMVLGLFGDLPLVWRQVIAVLLGIVAVTLLLEVWTRAQRLLPHRRWWAWLFAGLVFGGMLGNLGERALHWWVTDFLSFRWGDYWLPPGNVADLAIILAIPISLLIIAFEIEARAQRGRSPEGPRAPGSAG